MVKSIGQHFIPTGPFFFPADIKQFECKDGRYFWLDGTHLQILNEDNGELIKSVEVKADSFVFDSKENVVLLNKTSKELNYFNFDGVLTDCVMIYNNRDNLKLALTNDDEPVFYDTKNIIYN